MKLFYDIHGLTDKGPVRQTNEDHISVGRVIKNRGCVTLGVEADDDFLDSFGLLCAVADGVGGEAGGAIASQRALHAFDAQFYSFEKGADKHKSCSEGLLSAGERANRTLLHLQRTQPELAKMGCTLSGVCLTTDGLLTFNVGDSRTSRWRDGFIKQLTQDDSLTAVALAANLVTAEEAAKSDARHTILNVTGSPTFNLRLNEAPALRGGDCILICSDGLHDCVPIEKQEASFTQGGSAADMARRLLALALAHGTRDNVSIIVIRCAETMEAAEPIDTKPEQNSVPSIMPKTTTELIASPAGPPASSKEKSPEPNTLLPSS